MARYRIRFGTLKKVIREAISGQPMTQREVFGELEFDEGSQTFKDRWGGSLPRQPPSLDRRALSGWLDKMGVEHVKYGGRTMSVRKFLDKLFPTPTSDITPIVSGAPQSYVRR